MTNVSYQKLIGDCKFIYDNYTEPDYTYRDLVFASKEQLTVFKKLRELINNCYKKHINFGSRIVALEFCLTTHKTVYINNEYYTFNNACEILNLHPDVMRLRLMYEFYLQKYRLPLEYLNCDIKINFDIISEILLEITDFYIIEIVNYIYNNPSVTMGAVIVRFDERAKYLICKLILWGYIVDDHEFLYFTARNPKSKKINWITLL